METLAGKVSLRRNHKLAFIAVPRVGNRPRVTQIVPVNATAVAAPTSLFEKYRRVYKIGIVFLYLSAIHNVSSAVVKCLYVHDAIALINTVSLSVRVICSTLTAHLFYAVYPAVANFFAKEQASDPELYKTNRRRLRTKTVVVSALVVGYGISTLLLQSLKLQFLGLRAYFLEEIYFIDIENVAIGEAVLSLLAVLHFLAYDICNLFVPTACIVVYMRICDWCRLKVCQFRNIVQSCTREESILPPHIQDLQERYSSLWNSIQDLDHQFCLAVFLWYIDFVLNIIMKVRVLYYTGTDFNVFYALSVYVQLAYIGFVFLLISVSASNIVVEARHINYDICQLVCRLPTGDWHTCNQIMLLQEEIASCKLAFTGWNCFNVDRSFILAVIGAIVTYAVVLQQLT
ncbi:uncharacterized protein LOC135397493 [Ornithodoros turicata]|uniref:uncharacterized protein LOC135397493 n=1 Tax=Ornithodoros turicata TaxID=34597 RepID=UPI003139245C